MSEIEVVQCYKGSSKKLVWIDNSSVQKLLDAVVSIIADEHIEIAKENKEIFMDSHFRGNDKKENNNGYKFKPYYVAHTKIQTLALLDERYKGANWYHWRRLSNYVRTYFIQNLKH